MTETVVRQLADGEELVLEESTSSSLGDPHERTLETRRNALGDDESHDEGGEA
jgi:hypothetical protein